MVPAPESNQDLLITSQLLYQLSYTGVMGCEYIESDALVKPSCLIQLKKSTIGASGRMWAVVVQDVSVGLDGLVCAAGRMALNSGVDFAFGAHSLCLTERWILTGRANQCVQR